MRAPSRFWAAFLILLLVVLGLFFGWMWSRETRAIRTVELRREELRRTEGPVRELTRAARVLIHEGKYAEALATVEQILSLDPGNDYAEGVRLLLQDRLSKTAPGAPRVPPQGEAAERRLRAQLELTLPEARFDGIAFTDAIDFLRDVSGVNIFVNWKALEQAGVDRNAPVTVRFTNERLAKVLDAVLQQASKPGTPLGYMTDEGVISVSTNADLALARVTRTYDVRDLLPPVPAAPAGAPPEAVRKQAAASAERQAAVDRLVGAVRQDVNPASWRENGGGGTIKEAGGQLVVTQTVENHQAVTDKLMRMRQGPLAGRNVTRTAVVVAVLVLLAVAGVVVGRRMRAARWRAAGRCRRCGYDLRGSSDRCPECGEQSTPSAIPAAGASH